MLCAGDCGLVGSPAGAMSAVRARANVLANFALTHAHRGDVDKAFVVAKQAVGADPSCQHSRLVFAYVLLQKGLFLTETPRLFKIEIKNS
jgi:lipopolysaccharide biosynthesis regulator YciM